MRCYRLEVQARWWLVLAALFWACSGCTMVKKSPQKADQSRETKKVTAVMVTTNSSEDLPFFHQVRWEGETLSLIAKWYTGDWRNWKALAEVNPWVEPNNMFTGLKVKIPRQLLTNQKDMPREFVLSSASQNKARSQTNEVKQNEPPESSAEAREAKDSNMEFVVP
jgi:iron uptake system EfeUOB component EfeO/EfeM